MSRVKWALMASVISGAFGTLGAHAATVPPDLDSSSYQQGLTDRDAWETWFDGLHGSDLDGASYWAGQRSVRTPAPCGAHAAYGDDWLWGCLDAKRRLAVSDVKRKTDPQYWNGWNKVGTTPPVVAVTSRTTLPGPAATPAPMPDPTVISTGMKGKRPGDTLIPGVELTVSGGANPVITGSVRDIPDDAELLVSVSRRNGIPMGQDKAAVKGGVFKAGPFSDAGKPYGRGSYSIDVTFSFVDLQPPDVRAWFGSNAAYLDGPLVMDSSGIGMRTIVKEQSFTIP